VRAVEVVVDHELVQGIGSLAIGGERAGVQAFVQERAKEALDLAVGLGSIVPGEARAHVQVP
jgi:hypothetical protein